MKKTALICLAEGFEELEAVTAITVLRRADVAVTVAGLTSDPVRGARGVVVVPDMALESVKDTLFDALVLPGGAAGAKGLAQSPLVKFLAQSHAQNGRWVAAICASPAVVLAPLGMLDGKRAVCYPGMEQRFSPTTIFVNEPVVVDRPFLTGRAPGAALAFSLKLAEQLAGRDTSDRVRREMVV